MVLAGRDELAGLALNRLGQRDVVGRRPDAGRRPGWIRLSRLVCSIWNRSTCGVNGTRGGKCPFVPIGATKPGPRAVEFGSAMFGSDWTSRWVMVDCEMSWIVREVSGAWLLAKKAPVRASARAPSMAKTSFSVFPVIAGETFPSTRTPEQVAPGGRRRRRSRCRWPWPRAARSRRVWTSAVRERRRGGQQGRAAPGRSTPSRPRRPRRRTRRSGPRRAVAAPTLGPR